MQKIYLYSFLLLTNILFAQNGIKKIGNNSALNKTAINQSARGLKNNNAALKQWSFQANRNDITEEEILKNEISIYPNPTTGAFKLKSSLLNVNYILYNVLGQSINIRGSLKASITKLIDLSNLNDGVYLLKVNVNDDTFRTYKVIKRK